MILDSAQRIALARVNEGKNVFITGPAGTGKSSVTTEVIRRRIGDRSLKVCATTGVAALNLRDKLKAIFGEDVDTSTIYRWSGIGLGPRPGQSFDEYLTYMQSKGYGWSGTTRRINGTRTLIIDEVPMLPGRIIDFIDFVCRKVRKDDRPFGGIQVLAVVATVAFAGIASFGILSALKLVMPLRIRVDAEVQGIDNQIRAPGAMDDLSAKAEGAAARVGETVSDATITTKVKAQFAADDRVKAMSINVDTDNGVVTLRGDVANHDVHQRALDIARGVDGVKSIDDELKVGESS